MERPRRWRAVKVEVAAEDLVGAYFVPPLSKYWLWILFLGVVVGGLIVGIVESLAGFYLPEGWKDIAAYVVVLAVLLVQPPSSHAAWKTLFASGWMRVRARARQRGVELPLVVSDHADWDGLTATIAATPEPSRALA
mgnify:CR=1 FL=1